MLINTDIPRISDLGQIYHLLTVPRITVVLVLSFAIGYNLFRRSRRLNFPVVGNWEDADYRLAIREGVAKFPNSPFTIPDDPLYVVAPKSTIGDIKSFTQEDASFSKHLQYLFHSQFTNIGEFEDGALISVIKNDISRQLVTTLGILQEETIFGFDSCFGPSRDWTPVTLYPAIAKIVTLMSGRLFFGRPLSRNEELINTSIKFTIQATNVRDALAKRPKWFRNFLSTFYEEIKSLSNFKKEFAEIVRPIIDAHLAKEGNKKLYSDEGDEQGKFIACLLDRMPPGKRRNIQHLTNQLLSLSFASIHTTSITATQAIYDLASYREYIPLLVDEIKEVMAEDGYETADDGSVRLRKTSLPKLLKLDSFLKESQRVSPLSLVANRRLVTSDLMLSTGHLIPKGTHLCYPSWEIYNESTTLYLDGYTKPLNKFDGLRYYNLRRLPGNANRHYFVSTSPDNLEFGYGNQLCPGRFLANNEIKVILIELLLNWDFRFPDDVKMEGGAWRRPKNIFVKFDCNPDMKASVELRRRKKT
ncbi:Cytochrome P450 monooygenase 3 [Golovinomyces cichoracearum]|uniref:Cytochrome P450 monooygenase 3 n=1 Tax=Golovinomyces cichoracearum TaxID=62708 RepID=A0A420H912_9PEZI|nr:Cytochrome P450 monooygenase 3 [Golovinomyces cichoracearum]